MKCPNCWGEVPEGARFCSSCGARIGADNRVEAYQATDSAAVETGGVSAVLASGRLRSRLKMSPLILLVLVLAFTSVAAAAVYYAYTQAHPPIPPATEGAIDPDREVEFGEPLRSALLPQVDSNGDGRMTVSEVVSTIKLDLSKSEVVDVSEIVDISGLLAFENLESLDISATGVASANLSGLASLASLDAEGALLQNLDVSGDGQLRHLKCGDQVVVNGLDDTQLAEKWLMEKWLMTRYECEGVPGAQITQGTVGSYAEYVATFEYDEEGRLLSWHADYADLYGAGTRRSEGKTYEYDENGVVRDSDESTWGDGRAYDESGRLVSIGSSTAEYEGDKLARIVNGDPYVGSRYYGYDSAGRWVSLLSTSLLFYHEDTWEYDGADHIVSAKRDYREEKETGYTATFSYDEHGNLTERALTAHGTWVRSGGNGVARFEYGTRVFVAKEFASWQPLVFENPVSTPSQIEPWDSVSAPLTDPLDGNDEVYYR